MLGSDLVFLQELEVMRRRFEEEEERDRTAHRLAEATTSREESAREFKDASEREQFVQRVADANRGMQEIAESLGVGSEHDTEMLARKGQREAGRFSCGEDADISDVELRAGCLQEKDAGHLHDYIAGDFDGRARQVHSDVNAVD